MNTDYYRGKIIVGRKDNKDGIIIFATHDGGYVQDDAKGAEELTDKVRQILRTGDYTPADLQNGPAPTDGNHCGHYLDIFSALDPRVFGYLQYRLEQKE